MAILLNLVKSLLMRPIKAVSSANLMRGHFELCYLQSDVYNVKRNGANTVPWEHLYLRK